MKRAIPTMVLTTILFGLTAFFVGHVYKTGQDRPPLKYAVIPQGTLDFLRNHIPGDNEGTGIRIDIDGEGRSWSNDNDFGKKAEENWSCEEDENFIVYYHRDKKAEWQGNAQAILKCANKNIHTLAELMGKYFYPADVNGRKLPIYLPTSDGEYQAVISKLFEGPCSTSSIGMTITSVTLAGCETIGIVISPKTFKKSASANNNYACVLLHEMNHYVYLTSLDYSKEIGYFNWEIEGVADYCCSRSKDEQALSADKIHFIERNCSLDRDFPVETNSQYWAGENFFYYMEETYGRDKVKEFIHSSYSLKTAAVFDSLSLDEREEHSKWVKLNMEKSQIEEFSVAN